MRVLTHSSGHRSSLVRKVSLALLWVLLSPLAVILFLLIALQLPASGRFLAKHAISYLEQTTGAKISLEEISLDMSGRVQLRGLGVRSKDQDSVVYMKELESEIDYAALLEKKIRITSIGVSGLSASVSRGLHDTTFNYQFIIDAFSGDEETKPAADTSGGWDLDLGKITLQSCKVAYHDQAGGISLDVTVGHFSADLGGSQVADQRIRISDLDLTDTHMNLKKGPSALKATDNDTSAAEWMIETGHLKLERIGFSYLDSAGGLAMVLSLGGFALDGLALQTATGRVAAETLALNNASFAVRMNEGDTSIIRVADTLASHIAVNWTTKLRKLELQNCAFQFDDDRAAPVKGVADYSHLLIKNIQFTASDVLASADTVNVNMQLLSFSDKNGFSLKTLTGIGWYGAHGAGLSNFMIKTAASRLGGTLRVGYESLKRLAGDPGHMRLYADLPKSEVGMSDVFYFAPMVAAIPGLSLQTQRVIYLETLLKGTIDDLEIATLLLTCPAATIGVAGRMEGLPDQHKLRAAFTHFNVRGNGRQLGLVVPSTSAVSLPEWFELQGSFAGFMLNFNAEVLLTSSAGGLQARVKMDPEKGPDPTPYVIDVSLIEFDAGRLIRNPVIGAASLSLHAAGTGFDTATFNTAIVLSMESFRFNKYTYRNLNAQGQLLKQSFTGTAEMDDDNLAFDFEGGVNADRVAPHAHFQLDLKGIALKPLGFGQEDRRISTKVVSDMAIPGSGENPQGQLAIRQFLMLYKGRRIVMDSLVINSAESAGSTSCSIRSDFADADFAGKFRFADLPASLMAHLNSYFQFHQAVTSAAQPQELTAKFELKNTSVLADGVVPGLQALLPFTFTTSYNSSVKELNAHLTLPRITAGVTVDSLLVDIHSDNSRLELATRVGSASKQTLRAENISVMATAGANKMQFAVGGTHDDSSKVFGFSGELISRYPAYELRLDRKLVLGGIDWAIDSTNLVTFDPAGAVIHALKLQSGAQALSVQSEETAPGSPVAIELKQFDLSMPASLLNSDTALVSGLANGKVVIDAGSSNPAFRSDLQISALAVRGASLGDLTLRADNYADPANYDILLDLKGNGNDVEVSGSYKPAGEGNLNMSVNVNRLDVRTVEPVISSQVSRLAGVVSGSVGISGQLNAPRLRGQLRLNDLYFKPGVIASLLHIPDGGISFSGSSITFNNVEMLDSLGNKAVLSGSTDLSDLSNPKLDLKLKTTDFLALNTTREDNPLYHGKIFLNSDINVKGTASQPVLDVRARLNKGSSITYIKPESQAVKDESRGIVEFRDSLTAGRRIMQAQDTTAVVKGLSGVGLNASIQIDRDVQIKMIVDPLAGDSLFLKGGGMANFNLEPTGNTALSGKYTINSGGYFLTISDFIKRDFKIREGSSVTWSGDMLDAYLDLDAIYVIKASPVDLMADQIEGLTEPEKNRYRNLLTFHVFLKMRGFISSPEISFDIQLAPQDRGALNGIVNTRLGQLREDETQLNKQVFALLTLKRFVSENPLESGNESGLGSASRSSASQLLTTQLNTFADRYVNFVDLDLGVNSYEDYSTGRQQGRTQVQLGVSKQMFNDRVTVRVGGNVDVEGEQAQKNDANDVAGNISVDYKLTEDGRYKVKAFRENQYENPIEGELTRTGAGFVFTRDFNKFKNLFKSKRKREEQRKK
jgi:translocation and assembly module TamB